MAVLLKNTKLMKKGGTEITPDEHLKDKVVALYFSAHWCPPCRTFTPVLKDFYEELDGEPIEIVFVSFDHAAADMESYLKQSHGDWCYIPFGDPKIQFLTNKYDVQGIPTLVVVKPDGTEAVKNGRGDVQGKKPADTFKAWKAACFPG